MDRQAIELQGRMEPEADVQMAFQSHCDPYSEDIQSFPDNSRVYHC